MVEESKQKQQTNKEEKGLFGWYKRRVVRNEEDILRQYKESSGSWVFYSRFLSILVDIIVWGIIAVFVYVWWTTRGHTIEIGCKDISVNLCNQCYGQMKEIVRGGVGNIINTTLLK